MTNDAPDAPETVTAVTLTEDEQAALVAWGDAMDGWRHIARFYNDKANGHRLMPLYQEIGRWVGVSAPAVRSWVGMYNTLGDELIDEFRMFRLSHWRLIRSAVRSQPGYLKLDAEHKRALIGTVAARHHVNAMTPETLAAALNGNLSKPDPFNRALLRLNQAAESARKNADTKQKRARLKRVIEELANQV